MNDRGRMKRKKKPEAVVGTVELWAPIPFVRGDKITLQCDTWCTLLTLGQASELGVRLIRCAARKAQAAFRAGLART